MTNNRQDPGTSAWLDDESVTLPEETRANVSRRRRAIYVAMQELEVAVSRPSAMPDWRDRLESALNHVDSGLDSHIAEVQGPGGLYEEVIAREPRIAPQVNALIEGLAQLRDATVDALDGVRNPEFDKDRIRQRVNTVLMRLARHRQKGAEMLYDAYVVDIATGD